MRSCSPGTRVRARVEVTGGLALPGREVDKRHRRLKEPLLDLDSAATPSGPKPVADHDPIALLDHLQGFGPYPLEDLSQPSDVLAHPGVTAIRHVVGFSDPRAKLHIGVADGHQRLRVEPTHRVIRPLDALRVHRRHGCSISPTDPPAIRALVAGGESHSACVRRAAARLLRQSCRPESFVAVEVAPHFNDLLLPHFEDRCGVVLHLEAAVLPSSPSASFHAHGHRAEPVKAAGPRLRGPASVPTRGTR